MKRAATLAVFCVLLISAAAEADRVRVVHRGHRGRVVVHRGFPLHRTLPHVYVRSPRVAVHVTPRAFLPSVRFGAVVVAAPAADVSVWRESEDLERKDGWTEFTLNVDRRGDKLLLKIDEGPAQISFAEVVFENGESQVVDFSDKRQNQGIYSLLDFKDSRKVDHVRIVAKAARDSTEITLHLLT